MQQIINFLIKNSYKLLFLLLLGVSLTLTVKSHSYHRSQYINSSNAVSGYTYNQINSVKEYFGLRQKNEDLARENARLKEILFNKKDTILESKIVVPDILSTYTVRQAKVIKNSYSKQENFLTLDRGAFEGLKPDMAVISDRGVVGIIEKTSKNFATVISILHTKNPLNGKIKNSEHFGSITWDGRNAGYVQLIDVPKLATLKKGDTIVTGAQSAIFPENIPIGKIDRIFEEKATNKYVINIRLFNDMTSLGYVYIIENKKKLEKQALETETEKDPTKK
ncbi:rod shape-determining protein MreC [Flavobacterium terrigena]|uniref:Cell shape-determining protein MreC n=1 Tax=Flavobacterium terrigena TaxID=402734 RepID=A0A1H6SGQ6_9FLAO|nr:rod shape-determining protein MreC [Flavobacterium terrigena]SEI67123.1 rod shape-determining protein MreC [Flavobacterium terrigena]